MRLFVALELNSRVIESLRELVRRLAPLAPIRWVHPDNMHVTLKYIGPWNEDRLDLVTNALSRVRIATPIKVALAGLGLYPHPRNPRVFWVTAENSPPLRQLASSVDAVLSPLGIAPAMRPYLPHLTLGRLPGGCDLTEMHEAIEELPSRDFGTIEPESFVLFASMQTQEGPLYRRVDEFPFRILVRNEANSGLVLRG